MESTAAAIARIQSLKDGQIQPLPATKHLDASVHRWSQAEIDAITLALSARRPLLVRGEPGTGKTQLARAAADHLGWALQAVTIHPRFEASELLYRFDAVMRLADAQSREPKLVEEKYWEPGVLWKAFGWQDAVRFGSLRHESPPTPAGHVVLLDEIDKADSDVPNSLLDVLGQRAFEIPALNLKFGSPGAQLPLILITTNEERELPAAFMRRCLVLDLERAANVSYERWLVDRGQAHFGGKYERPTIDDAILNRGATRLVKDRERALEAGVPPPGLAEYLDLLTALHELAPNNTKGQGEWMERLDRYAFVKHRIQSESSAATSVAGKDPAAESRDQR